MTTPQSRIFTDPEDEEYDPDMREDEPPHDINEIEWSGGALCR